MDKIKVQPFSVMQEAEGLVNGARAAAYGHPYPNHEVIANLWNAFLDNKAVQNPGPITPQEVCLMMTLLKIARLQFNVHHRDSLVDVVGYASCIERMNAYEVERDSQQEQG